MGKSLDGGAAADGGCEWSQACLATLELFSAHPGASQRITQIVKASEGMVAVEKPQEICQISPCLALSGAHFNSAEFACSLSRVATLHQRIIVEGTDPAADMISRHSAGLADLGLAWLVGWCADIAIDLLGHFLLSFLP